MKELALTATKRDGLGKGPARRARAEGLIPAVVYGPESKPVTVSVKARELHTTMKQSSGTAIINLDVDGSASRVIVRDIQRDPVTSRIVHLDFHAISMNKPINVAVPIHFIGTPVGVKTDGGIMQVVMHEVDISCLPADIPEKVEIDVSELSIGESVHVKDLSIPNARIHSSAQQTVCVIAAPTVIKSETTAAAEGEAAEEGEEAAEATAETETEEKKEE